MSALFLNAAFAHPVEADLVLDGKTNRPVTLKFEPGKDHRGRSCLKATLSLSGAKTIGLKPGTVRVFDPKTRKPREFPLWANPDYMVGLGKDWKMVTDHIPLAKFKEFVAKSAQLEEFRAPSIPTIAGFK